MSHLLSRRHKCQTAGRKEGSDPNRAAREPVIDHQVNLVSLALHCCTKDTIEVFVE